MRLESTYAAVLKLVGHPGREEVRVAGFGSVALADVFCELLESVRGPGSVSPAIEHHYPDIRACEQEFLEVVVHVILATPLGFCN